MQAGVEEVVDTDGTPLTSFASSFGIKRQKRYVYYSVHVCKSTRGSRS